MATRDYANRKPSKKGKKRMSAKNDMPLEGVSWYMIVIIFLAICLFGYFLWSLKSSDSSKPEAEKPQAEKVIPIRTKPEEALPPKPKEEWTYQEELENKRVEVDLPEQVQTVSRPYQIQCASFRTEDQADELRARIAFQGLEAHVRRTEGETGAWYKVFLGPYPHKRAAERHRHVLQRGGINGCQIWLWQGK